MLFWFKMFSQHWYFLWLSKHTMLHTLCTMAFKLLRNSLMYGASGSHWLISLLKCLCRTLMVSCTCMEDVSINAEVVLRKQLIWKYFTIVLTLLKTSYYLPVRQIKCCYLPAFCGPGEALHWWNTGAQMTAPHFCSTLSVVTVTPARHCSQNQILWKIVSLEGGHDKSHHHSLSTYFLLAYSST